MTAEVGGFIFCIEQDLFDQIKAITIDLTGMGFLVTPESPLPTSGDVCGSGCGSCCGGCGSR